MQNKELYYKILDRIYDKTHRRKKGDKPIFERYPSFWHSKFHKGTEFDTTGFYLTARPNPGAGIGHQMSNWIAGRWFANYFGVNFAHIPFSSQVIPNTTNSWETFLNFGYGEKNAYELIKAGYKKVRLPKFKETEEEIEIIRKIIFSYSGEKVLFICEQDQFYHDQYGVMDDIQNKFYAVHKKDNENLLYDKNAFNIAIHVRRGDIVQQRKRNDPNSIRFQSNEYFVNALQSANEYFRKKDNIQIYLFSQGKKEDYPEFKQFKNLHFCLDMGAKDSFLHMVFADALITSKSSFSYNPALLSKGIKFCPQNFWHGYPDNESWILLDDEGKM